MLRGENGIIKCTIKTLKRRIRVKVQGTFTNKGNKEKPVLNMVNTHPTISVITLNVNSLTVSVKSGSKSRTQLYFANKKLSVYI